ncbi:hypothetical protein H5410_062142 [Solanum commersonii]|uniref:Uncharacterized protein n=1 Tax=Solanum commersonii TaxID=4109 RepID=A0A9J5WBD3_SOLCO|nr:hypothetical protein H5410_062142 [Solanum commersonii]
MRNLFSCVALKEWEHLFDWLVPSLHEAEVCEFYYNMEFREDNITKTKVCDVYIHLTKESLAIILEVSRERIKMSSTVVESAQTTISMSRADFLIVLFGLLDAIDSSCG